MLFENIIPHIPQSLAVISIYIGSILGTILVAYAIFLEKEHKQDLALAVGAILLFIYALYIRNIFFMIAMGGLGIAAIVEYIQIHSGHHAHSKEDIKRYKKFKK